MMRARKIVCQLLLVILILSQLSCQRAVSDEKETKADEKKFTNRLAKETSPYLLLHAHNPVDWFPWGPEALEKAKKENKVIFLSVGYSSCHWCHVMERESFMDKKIAAFLNKHFVCIKVDREERPDVDKIYMTAVQAYAGRGGWPMSVFMTPDAKPFFGGTYFPARDGDRGQATGFETLLQRVQEAWKDKEKLVRQDADRLTEYVKRQLEGQISLAKIKADQFGKVYDSLEAQFDPQYGGFGYDRAVPQRPKFPEPSNLLFMLRFIDKEKDAERKKNATKMLTFSLDRMAMGGIWDHLGGGFHRYSVDRYWMIPHFEKMLYDNAQLATVYAEAYQLTGHQRYRRVVEEMLDFVIREMTDEKGGYYSALDAESEGEEGKFYRWKKDDIQKLLTKEEFDLFAKVYGLNDPPNFEEHYYAPQFGEPLGDIAKTLSMSEDDLQKKLAPIRKKLFDVRAKRKRPLTDTKVLTAWNGLMIRGMADAGRILKEKRFTESAVRSAEFVWNSLRDKKGRLLRTYGGGKAKLNAYLVDYAFLIDGFIALHESTGDKKWLERADQLMQIQLKQFKDERRGGFYFTSEDHESLLSRQKNPVDSAQPSGNSISAMNLIYLGEKLKKPEYIEQSRKAVNSVASLLERIPALSPRTSVAASILIARHPEPESKEDDKAGTTGEKGNGTESKDEPNVKKKDVSNEPGNTGQTQAREEKPEPSAKSKAEPKTDANGKPVPTTDKALEGKK